MKVVVAKMEGIARNGNSMVAVGFADGGIIPAKPPSLDELARVRPQVAIERLLNLAIQAEKEKELELAKEYLAKAIKIEERFA